ncbi:phage baseplate assembly protein [Polaromonas sp. UC242_47]|uniref:phage baseplate assembly protein domain-containing protein n=1 Tax=Polaromonas sp. UC242_47 TaxID=3374626 RepID=UPI0037B6F18D
MSTPAIFLRRARLRSLKEGLVQTVRTEATENDAKDAIERMQDYGFAANVVDGQGLVLTIDGTVIVLRMDRIADRPRLAAYEVSVWHKEGHNVTLRDGKVVETNCDIYRVNAAVKVELNTPTVAMSTKATVGDTLDVKNGLTGGGNATFAAGRVSALGVTAAGKNLDGHDHNETGVRTGPNN